MFLLLFFHLSDDNGDQVAAPFQASRGQIVLSLIYIYELYTKPIKSEVSCSDYRPRVGLGFVVAKEVDLL